MYIMSKLNYQKVASNSSPLNEETIVRFCSVAKNQMSINQKAYDEDILHTIFSHVIYFNSLAEDTMTVGDRPIESWVILNEFKDFILPNSIRFENGNRLFNDLLNRPVLPASFKPDYNSYNDALKQFRNWYKKDANDNVTRLSDLRVNKSLSDIWSIVASQTGKVRYIDNSFVPIILSNFNVGQKDSYFTNEVNEILEDYIKDIKLK